MASFSPLEKEAVEVLIAIPEPMMAKFYRDKRLTGTYEIPKGITPIQEQHQLCRLWQKHLGLRFREVH